mmetsp:Transcript_74376/g.131379  ORF Transcript_74376/g.131379 Transcript_74376/m.131379 type:complete len:215 (-) Transcript_74376:4282-4926(-)
MPAAYEKNKAAAEFWFRNGPVSLALEQSRAPQYGSSRRGVRWNRGLFQRGATSRNCTYLGYISVFQTLLTMITNIHALHHFGYIILYEKHHANTMHFLSGIPDHHGPSLSSNIRHSVVRPLRGHWAHKKRGPAATWALDMLVGAVWRVGALSEQSSFTRQQKMGPRSMWYKIVVRLPPGCWTRRLLDKGVYHAIYPITRPLSSKLSLNMPMKAV